ncbi:MAG TPA: glycosyl transferase, partial [Clostridium sp.]|nr:glycosyl transferase [Clostridium sp.]
MISICMIVKDEEENLEKSLKSIVRYGYEIIVVDTGSTDNSKKVALKYTKNVFDFVWCDDFSKARNFSISKSTNDFVLILDADEIVEEFNVDELERKIKNNKSKVGRIYRKNTYIRDNNNYTYCDYIMRLFNKKIYRYDGSIHEQVVSNFNSQIETYELPIRVTHNGYSDKEVKRKNKIHRNISMLKKSLKIQKDPYVLYQLGKSYYMECDYLQSKIYFEQALLFDLNISLEYVQDLIETYGYTLINLCEYENSLKLLNLYDYFKKSADFVFLIGLIYMNNGLFYEAIDEFKKCSRFKISKMEGINSFLSNYNIGVILECLGNT